VDQTSAGCLTEIGQSVREDGVDREAHNVIIGCRQLFDSTDAIDDHIWSHHRQRLHDRIEVERIHTTHQPLGVKEVKEIVLGIRLIAGTHCSPCVETVATGLPEFVPQHAGTTKY